MSQFTKNEVQVVGFLHMRVEYCRKIENVVEIKPPITTFMATYVFDNPIPDVPVV